MGDAEETARARMLEMTNLLETHVPDFLVPFLHQETDQWKWNREAPICDFLYHIFTVQNNKPLIEKYFNVVIEDCKAASQNELYHRIAHEMYKGINMAEKNTPLTINDNTDDKWMEELSGYLREAVMNPKTKVSEKVPEELQKKLPSENMENINQYIGKVSRASGLTTVHILPLEARFNVALWWKGEITGHECSKILVDMFESAHTGPPPLFKNNRDDSKTKNQYKELKEFHFFGQPKKQALESAYFCLTREFKADDAEAIAGYKRQRTKTDPLFYINHKMALQIIKESK